MYRVVEIMATLQGEGAQAGTPAVFVRFAGCNLWAGEMHRREPDAARNQASCPLWCDTDFRGGTKMGADEIVAAVRDCSTSARLIVITGGEPLLQLDATLCKALRATGARLALETNGSVAARPGVRELLDWICVSPKQAASTVVVRGGDEIKIVVPALNPLDYAELAQGFSYRFVQPQARVGDQVGQSWIDDKAVQAAVQFCLDNPDWRLSSQIHKMIGLP